jgi:protein involved in polysaccharide export with SLBB domain
VRHPGSYTLPRERQHLSDLVALAGGVDDDAFPEAATLTRVEFVAGSGAAGVSTSIAIDLAAAIRQPHGAADIEVRDGDVLTIPRNSGVVVVRGAVQRPMTLQHRPGATLQDYLGLAGGLGLRADASRITITAPNSTASLVARGQNPVLMAGSAIDVPLQRADERLRVVEVKGAVATPAVVQFTDGARLSYYVGVCGGFAASADLDRIVVLTPDGGMLARDGAKEFNPDVPPGSIIVVTSKAPAIPAADAK